MVRSHLINHYLLSLFLAGALGLFPADLQADAEGEVPILERMINHALETQPDGAVVDWSDGKRGKSGEITVISTFFSKSGPCRRYRWTMAEKGQSGTETVEGTGCRRPDATWTRDEGIVAKTPTAPDPAEPVAPDAAEGDSKTAEAVEPPAATEDTPPAETSAAAAAEPIVETPPIPQSKPEAPVVLVTLPRRSSD